MELTKSRVAAVMQLFRPYGVAIMTDEAMHGARAALASLVRDVHATGRSDLLQLVNRAAAEVSADDVGELELWLVRLQSRL